MMYGGKVMLIVIAVLTLMGFATGNLGLNRDNVKCFGSKHWTFDKQHRVWLALGQLEFKYQPVTYDCDAETKLDSTKYELRNGIVELKAGADLSH